MTKWFCNQNAEEDNGDRSLAHLQAPKNKRKIKKNEIKITKVRHKRKRFLSKLVWRETL